MRIGLFLPCEAHAPKINSPLSKEGKPRGACLIEQGPQSLKITLPYQLHGNTFPREFKAWRDRPEPSG